MNADDRISEGNSVTVEPTAAEIYVVERAY